MTLVLTLVLTAIALFALFLGLSIVMQNYLYSTVVDRLPIRAAVGGLAIACFLTFWTYVNTRAEHRDKYGTLFEFTPSSVKTVEEFEAVRQLAIKDEQGKPKQLTAKYKWQPGGGSGKFVDAESGKDFRLNDTNSMTVALEVPEAEGKKTRFEAELKDGNYVGKGNEERLFIEQGGSRTIDGMNPRLMTIPSSSAMVLALLLNAMLFVVWLLVFWPVLGYNVGHSLGLTAIFAGVTMFVVMPLYFSLNTVKPGVGAAAVAK